MVTLKGVFHPNRDLVVMSNIGSSDSSAIICYTNYSDVHGSGHEGKWISPDGTTVDSNGRVPGFTTTRGPLIVRLLRTSGTPQQGIYQCVVRNDTAVLYTMHVGLYNSGEGIVCYCVEIWFDVFKEVYTGHHLCVDTGHIQLSGGITFTLDSDSRFTLTCISTGGPATTVTWTRYGSIFTIGRNVTVLDDPVTARYTHTLTVTRIWIWEGRYICTVANKVFSFSSAELSVTSKKTECDIFYSSF